MSTTYYYDSDDSSSSSSSCCSENDHVSSSSSDMSMMVMDDIIEHLTVMRHQEVGYKAKDYLSILDDHQDNESDNDVIMSNDGSIDEACRTAMSNWMYTVVDTLKLPREAVTIAMSYVDRFLSTKSGLSSFENRMEFQLTCMTCFYMAIKVHSPVAIDTSLVSQLSRHQFTPEQVEQREMDVLTALKWKVNPPTALSFIEYFRQILTFQFQLVDGSEEDEDDNDDMFDAMYDLAKYQVEVSTNNYMLSVGLKPSMVALAAFANALETIDMVDTTVQNEMISSLMSSLMMMTATEKMNTNKIFTVRTCLYETVTMAGNNGSGLQPQPTTTKTTKSRRRQKARSPSSHSANNKHRGGMNCSGSPRSVTLQQHQQQPTAVST